MSSEGVTWTPDNICVFDGLEHVRTLCTEWYSQRVASSPGAQPPVPDDPERELDLLISPNDPDNLASPMAQLSIFVADAIVDRKSVFVGRSCPISHPSQVGYVLNYLMSDKHIARAAHPVIHAWRCDVDGVLHQGPYGVDNILVKIAMCTNLDNDDDGESAAGGRLAHLPQILDVNNVLVVVTRIFGGIHLGPDRFK